MGIDMKKSLILFFLLLIPKLAIAGSQQIRNVVTMAKGSSATCNSSAFFTQTAESGNIQVRSDDDYTYFGGIWSGTPFTLCKAGVRVAEWAGNIDAKTYRVEVWSINGTSLQTRKGYSETRLGTSFNYPAATVDFTFSTHVNVESGDAIVFVNLEAVDSSNFVRVYSSSSDTELNYSLWRGDLTRSTSVLETTPSFVLYKYE